MVVVVQLVQLVVVVEVTSQAADITRTALIVSPAATPLPPPPSAGSGLPDLDAIGLLTGSIAMLAAAGYVAIESKGVELNKQMRPLKPGNTHIWGPFEKEDAHYILASASSVGPATKEDTRRGTRVRAAEEKLFHTFDPSGTPADGAAVIGGGKGDYDSAEEAYERWLYWKKKRRIRWP
jgi:hypothetical protein